MDIILNRIDPGTRPDRFHDVTHGAAVPDRAIERDNAVRDGDVNSPGAGLDGVNIAENCGNPRFGPPVGERAVRGFCLTDGGAFYGAGNDAGVDLRRGSRGVPDQIMIEDGIRNIFAACSWLVAHRNGGHVRSS
jgi:hypothetical protein